MQFARGPFSGTGDDVGTLVRFAWEIGGAVAFGCLVGALFALYLRYVGREVTLVLRAYAPSSARSGTTQQFEPLLAAVAAGWSSRTWRSRRAMRCKTAVQRGATPVLVIFFVASRRLARSGRARPWSARRARQSSVIRVGAHAPAASPSELGVSGLDADGLRMRGPVSSRRPASPWGSRRSWRASFRAGAQHPDAAGLALIAIHELAGPLLFRQGLARERRARRRTRRGR